MFCMLFIPSFQLTILSSITYFHVSYYWQPILAQTSQVLSNFPVIIIERRTCQSENKYTSKRTIQGNSS